MSERFGVESLQHIPTLHTDNLKAPLTLGRLEVNPEGIRNVPGLREFQGIATHVASFDFTQLPQQKFSSPTTVKVNNARMRLSQGLAQRRGLQWKPESLGGKSRKNVERSAGQSNKRAHGPQSIYQVWKQVVFSIWLIFSGQVSCKK